jgi:hypothetical protein
MCIGARRCSSFALPLSKSTDAPAESINHLATCNPNSWSSSSLSADVVVALEVEAAVEVAPDAAVELAADGDAVAGVGVGGGGGNVGVMGAWSTGVAEHRVKALCNAGRPLGSCTSGSTPHSNKYWMILGNLRSIALLPPPPPMTPSMSAAIKYVRILPVRVGKALMRWCM